MAISEYELRQAAQSVRPAHVRTLVEAKALNIGTAFLCHSHKDETLVRGLLNLLQDSGWRVYVDWADTSMPAKPNRQTAQRIQEKIVSLDYFLFLATENSMASRWCPWEIGYADGKKPHDRILIIPTQVQGNVIGNEYLSLYRRIDKSSAGVLAAWIPGDSDHGVNLRNF